MDRTKRRHSRHSNAIFDDPKQFAICEGIWAAVKADALSLTSWQVGMYDFMAFAQFYLFEQVWNHWIDPNIPEFWYMLQIAMMAGFATSYPVNWWLIRTGIKEKM